ncbi:MAG: hypothetical protein HY094_10855 [Candidatus Melainabacteria bacterium]|nr:hypothetical protein [Candidatus Melainabacteria bacterium]
MSNNIQKPISVTVHSSNGMPVVSDSRNLKADISLNERFNNPFKYQAAYLMDYYFAKQLNRLPFRKANLNSLPTPPTEVKNPLIVGMGPFIATTETIAAGFLLKAIPGISTFINLVTTLGEFLQTWAAGTDSLGNPNDPNRKKAEEAKDRREAYMAWTQVIAGGGGALGFIWDRLFGKEHNVKEIPLWEKIALSISSAFNGVFMFFGSAEKTLISGLSRNEEKDNLRGNEYEDMEINGHNDRRCTAEWSIMTLLPWISNINPIKNIVDLVVIYGALREGFDHFVSKNKIQGICNDLNKIPILKGLLQSITNPISKIKELVGMKARDRNENEIVCFPFSRAKEWLLGTETDQNGPGTSGFRYKYMLPVLKFFGANPPVCYLDKAGSVVSEFYSGDIDKSTGSSEVRKQTRQDKSGCSLTPTVRKQAAVAH